MDQNLHLLYLLVSFSIVMQYGIEQFCCSDTQCTVLQIPSAQAFQYWVAMTMCARMCVCLCVCVCGRLTGMKAMAPTLFR